MIAWELKSRAVRLDVSDTIDGVRRFYVLGFVVFLGVSTFDFF